MAEEIQNQEQDLSKFEFQKGYSLGCREGYHDINQGKTELQVIGNDTMIVMECLRCGAKISKLADLNINDLIQEYGKIPGLQQPSETFEAPKGELNDGSEDFWNKLQGK